MDVSIAIRDYITHRDGFYIECGANDGLTQSNTFYYEDTLDWRGLLIEPSPKAWAQCLINRSVEKNIIENCALVGCDYRGTTVKGDFDGNLMSSIDGARRSSNELLEVPARTLSSVLDEHNINSIDFLSLDVEGREYDALTGIDFARHRPTWILVEVYSSEVGRILTLLSKHSYMFKKNLSGFNVWENPSWDGTHNDYLFVDARIPNI